MDNNSNLNKAFGRVAIAPSILSADFANMGAAVKCVSENGADLIHVDVMDGMFVPNITFGQKMVKDIRCYTDLPLDVHLMIEQPWRYIESFAQVGADYITVHYKACKERLSDTLKIIGSFGKKRGIAINPDVPFEAVVDTLPQCDLLLIMSVYPGFGGQKYIDSVTEKIKTAKAYITANNLDILIEVDGGINQETACIAKNAGADILVAGSAVFGKDSVKDAIEALR